MPVDKIPLEIRELIHQTNEDFIKKELLLFLRTPSVTLDEEGIKESLEYLDNYISDFGHIVMRKKHHKNPVILIEIEGNEERKLGIYMMYDTQPISKMEEWIADPFGAEIKHLDPPLNSLGDCIIARGAYNSKTSLISFLNVLKLLKKKGKLPISVLLILDGEEEIGSPTLLHCLAQNEFRSYFSKINDIFYPSTKQDLNGKAILKLGYKGILSITIEATSPNKEPHSSFSSMIPNPARDLMLVLNSLYNTQGFQFPPFNQEYVLSDEEKLVLKRLESSLELESIKKKAGITETLHSSPELFKSYLFDPTFNISTIKSGHIGEGIKNMVPNHAICNIDIRFAHRVSVDYIISQIRKTIENLSDSIDSNIHIQKNIGYEGSRVDINSPLTRSILKSFKQMSIEQEIWPISAAAAPLSALNKELGLNFLVGGLGIGGYAHSPNEFIQLASIEQNRLNNYLILQNYSEFSK